MKSFLILLGVTLCASRSISEGIYDASVEDEWHLVARCQQYCGANGRRCLELPLSCGNCVHGFIEKDGECLPLDLPYPPHSRGSVQSGPDADIDNIAAAIRQSAPQGAESADLKPSWQTEDTDYQVHQVGHEPYHSQKVKLNTVLNAAKAPRPQQVPDEVLTNDEDEEEVAVNEKARDEEAELPPRPAYIKDDKLEAQQPHGHHHDVASMSDVYFLVKNSGNHGNNKRGDNPSPTDPPGTTTTEELPTAQPQAGNPPDSDNIPDSAVSEGVFYAVVAGCSVAGLVGLIVAGVCWYKLQKNVKAASDVDYPAYGVTGPNKEKVGSPGDRKLAQSAQMYHYQHQKQQMIAMEKANNDLTKDGSEVDTDEENEEGDYTVFECPGLAPTGEMEVKNPLFNEETPVTPSGDNNHQ